MQLVQSLPTKLHACSCMSTGTRFLDRCAKNAFCNSKFPDVVTGNLPLSNLIMRIYTRLDARRPGGVAESLCYPLANWTDTPPSHTLRRFLTTLLMNVNLRGMIPAIVYRLHRCTRQDDHVLAFLQRKIANPSQGRKGFTQLVLPTLRSPTVQGDALVEMNAMLYNLIVFSEEWTYPTPSVADLQLSFESQPFGLGVFDLVPAYCVATNFRDEACRSLRPLSKATPAPYVYARDSFFNHSSTIPPHASVLFLSGTLDPQTELRHGRAEFAALRGTQKRWVEFPDAPHCTAFQTPMLSVRTISC
ncbi:hypothetical protein DYB25_004542 [Aphanomyces astaci]|uniref:Peptidase S33 tripeptidyl aminopeptidase-like C-terminal domain-containing protein n=1 Tax=Aphanomyces astaci TaxID=112090 RepID=A0A397B3C4_APHAT|nr:hypothetical protein DYB25_004542 [Aphanomyces astaci]